MTKKQAKKKITKEELLKRFKEMLKESDHESTHWEADNLLIEYIGDKEIAKAFDKLEKWYA